jgi:hypothetical protein
MHPIKGGSWRFANTHALWLVGWLVDRLIGTVDQTLYRPGSLYKVYCIVAISENDERDGIDGL